MRQAFGIGLMFAALALASGCGRKATPPNLEGTWTLIHYEVSGDKVQTEADLAKLPAEERKIRITGDQLIATKRGKEHPANYKLNTAKTPHQIDLIPVQPSDSNRTVYGIFKLEGDTLTICLAGAADAEERPKEFTTATGFVSLMVLKKD